MNSMFSTFRKFFSVQLVFHHPKYENSYTFCQKRGFVYFFHLQCPNMSPISSKINDYGIQFLAFRLDMLIFPPPSSGSISHQVMEVELKPLRGLTMDKNLVGVNRYQIRYNNTSTGVSGRIRAYCALGNISAMDTPHI